MREQRHGGGGARGPQRRSRSRSRSPPRHKTAHFPRDPDEAWRYSRAYYRSPSPVRPDRRSLCKRMGSPRRTASVRREHRYGDYYKDSDSVGSVRTLTSPHRRDRRDRDELDRDRLRSSGLPVRYGLESNSYQARDFDFDREVYKEEREGYFRKVSGRGSEGLRFRYDSVSGDKLPTGGVSRLLRDGVGGVSDFGTGTVPVSVERGGSRGYFGQLVDRNGSASGSGREYGRGSIMNGVGSVGGGYVSPPALRKCEVGRGSLGTVPGEFSVRTSVVEPIARKVGGGGTVGSLFRDGMRESNWGSDSYGSIQDTYADIGRVMPLTKEREAGDEGYLKSWRSFDGEEVKLVEESSFRGNVATGGGGSSAVGIGSYGDGLGRLQAPYEGLYMTGGGPQGYKEEEFRGIREQSEVLLQGKCGSDIEIGEHNHKTDWYPLDGSRASRSMDGEWTNEDLPQVKYVDDLGFGNSCVRSARATDMMIDNDNENESNDPLSPQRLQVPEKNHWSKPRKPFKKDIKKRLGPAARNVKQRLGPVQNVKQRLGPVANAGKPQRLARKFSRKLPWVEIYERRIIYDVDRSDSPQPVEFSEVKKKKLAMVKTEPPEDSEEFVQLVQSAFLKFVKLLNENSAYRRRYMEQGGSGPFKCSVCGSFSEFADTLSLAQHAFQSCKVGCRSEHLGFHKAICVLMGWKCAEVPNSSWARQILPASEASSVKEDLIIWPPVVFMHNSSIVKGNPDDRIVVSSEQLRDVLKGMGFGQCMTNLCRGKAANQSVMVASFTGTFSGLQEAERLHRLYTDNQHGRVEFQQIISGSSSSSKEAQKLSTDKVESVLYGYLGTAGDLDKLDFETKKKCQVKSKKEIEAIADAPLAS